MGTARSGRATAPDFALDYGGAIATAKKKIKIPSQINPEATFTMSPEFCLCHIWEHVRVCVTPLSLWDTKGLREAGGTNSSFPAMGPLCMSPRWR